MRFLRPIKLLAALAIVAGGAGLLEGAAGAQATVSPSAGLGITAGGGVCTGSAAGGDFPISITLPPTSVLDKVDVALLMDDTGSMSGEVGTVESVFGNIVDQLQAALPSVNFGFGVSMFKDYGGAWSSEDGDDATSRPFFLDQPIITADTAGGPSALDTAISNALNMAESLPGFGGDGPESDLEGLYQLATGAGLDGNGNGNTTDSGAAGSEQAQTDPKTSGDVPAFSSNVLPTSGSLGGIGWRPDALHLVLVATDTNTVAAFPAGSPIPKSVTSTNGVTEPSANFASSSTTPGSSRFGYVANTTDPATNTVDAAVAPVGAATVQGTVNALNALGIRVIGMGPGSAPTSEGGPASGESVWMSSMARLTGATDAEGTPLVFNTNVSTTDLTSAIVNNVQASATRPVDVALITSTLPAGITSVTASPTTVDDVAPGGTASFTLDVKGDGSNIQGDFTVDFVDTTSGAQLGTLPVSIDCTPVTKPSPLATQGYRLLGGDGGIFDYGGADFYGSAGSDLTACPPVTSDRSMPNGSCWSMATAPDTKGYWTLNASTGAILSYGDAGNYGSPATTFAGVPRDLVPTFLGIAATPDGKGYWIVDSDGGVFAFGDAGFYGSMGAKPLNQPVVGIAPTPDGGGYWLTAADGGVFAFGDAGFYGSMGAKPLNQPVSGIAANPTGGYWLSARDGGVFAFGGAPFLGSMGGLPLNQPIFAINSATTQSTQST